MMNLTARAEVCLMGIKSWEICLLRFFNFCLRGFLGSDLNGASSDFRLLTHGAFTLQVQSLDLKKFHNLPFIKQRSSLIHSTGQEACTRSQSRSTTDTGVELTSADNCSLESTKCLKCHLWTTKKCSICSVLQAWSSSPWDAISTGRSQDVFAGTTALMRS